MLGQSLEIRGDLEGAERELTRCLRLSKSSNTRYARANAAAAANALARIKLKISEHDAAQWWAKAIQLGLQSNLEIGRRAALLSSVDLGVYYVRNTTPADRATKAAEEFRRALTLARRSREPIDLEVAAHAARELARLYEDGSDTFLEAAEMGLIFGRRCSSATGLAIGSESAYALALNDIQHNSLPSAIRHLREATRLGERSQDPRGYEVAAFASDRLAHLSVKTGDVFRHNRRAIRNAELAHTQRALKLAVRARLQIGMIKYGMNRTKEARKVLSACWESSEVEEILSAFGSVSGNEVVNLPAPRFYRLPSQIEPNTV
jgi:hypothetical protein